MQGSFRFWAKPFTLKAKQNLFIIELTYKVPLEAADKYIDEHKIFLKKYYQNQVFVLSGRKSPRTGGIIIAKGKSRTTIEEIMQKDPLVINNIADFSIVEFNPNLSQRMIGGTLRLLLQ